MNTYILSTSVIQTVKSFCCSDYPVTITTDLDKELCMNDLRKLELAKSIEKTFGIHTDGREVSWHVVKDIVDLIFN
ncbi:hypothetical protein [Parabacteroides merdae]|uniref:hypothetical protein n=1 Tax=Parabacteroides merdae TaxID=46503 RepID=UPI0034A507EA